MITLTFLGFVATAVSGCIWLSVLLNDLLGQVKLEAISQGSFGPGGGRL